MKSTGKIEVWNTIFSSKPNHKLPERSKAKKARTIDLRMKEFELYILCLRLQINLSSILVNTSKYDCYTVRTLFISKKFIKRKEQTLVHRMYTRKHHTVSTNHKEETEEVHDMESVSLGKSKLQLH